MARNSHAHTSPSNSGRNRPAGGPNGVQRSYASQLKEHEPLFNTYEHLHGLSRGDDALRLLRKVASIVKPIMRKRGWHVQILAEFLPAEANLLGLNINSGYKICVRLRYARNPDLFLPLEELVDTMLHELSHNVWGEHDSNFHRLWDELRDEHETLLRKGYTGEGFLTAGRRLGGFGDRMPPADEMRRLARASAEKRKAQGKLSQGSGKKVGGTPLHLFGDVRSVIADQIIRRNTVDRGCASGRQDAGKLSDQSSSNTFKTKAEEDDANDRAIAQALYELIEQEEEQKLSGAWKDTSTHGGLAWDPKNGLYSADKVSPEAHRGPSEDEQLKWALCESAIVSPLTPGTPEVSDPSSHQAMHPPPVPHGSKPGSRLLQQTEREIFPRQAQASNQARPDLVSPQSDNAEIEAKTPIIDLTDPWDPRPQGREQWACEICTCLNPMRFLACEACGVERPQPSVPTIRKVSTAAAEGGPPQHRRGGGAAGGATPAPSSTQIQSLGWICSGCGSFMEHKWWTCSACGRMKASS